MKELMMSSDTDVTFTVKYVRNLVEAYKNNPRSIETRGLILEIEQLLPIQIPDIPEGATFTARWKNPRNGRPERLRFFVMQNGNVIGIDGDDSGWEYIDLNSIRDVAYSGPVI
jgi:hypothetical protein